MHHAWFIVFIIKTVNCARNLMKREKMNVNLIEEENEKSPDHCDQISRATICELNLRLGLISMAILSGCLIHSLWQFEFNCEKEKKKLTNKKLCATWRAIIWFDIFWDRNLLSAAWILFFNNVFDLNFRRKFRVSYWIIRFDHQSYAFTYFELRSSYDACCLSQFSVHARNMQSGFNIIFTFIQNKKRKIYRDRWFHWILKFL